MPGGNAGGGSRVNEDGGPGKEHVAGRMTRTQLTGRDSMPERKRHAANASFCGRCGYNLTGCASNRCPECGWHFLEAARQLRQAVRRQRRLGLALYAVTLAFAIALCAMYVELRYQLEVARAGAENANAILDVLVDRDPLAALRDSGNSLLQQRLRSLHNAASQPADYSSRDSFAE